MSNGSTRAKLRATLQAKMAEAPRFEEQLRQAEAKVRAARQAEQKANARMALLAAENDNLRLRLQRSADGSRRASDDGTS